MAITILAASAGQARPAHLTCNIDCCTLHVSAQALISRFMLGCVQDEQEGGKKKRRGKLSSLAGNLKLSVKERQFGRPSVDVSAMHLIELTMFDTASIQACAAVADSGCI